MAIETTWKSEIVYRAKCRACGCTGPGAVCINGAEFLAVLCGWDEQKGMCQACSSMRRTIKAGKEKKPARAKNGQKA